MNKKIIVFRILIILIVLVMIGVVSIIVFNKKNNDSKIMNGINSIIKKDEVKSNDSNDNVFYNYDEKRDYVTLHLTYNKSELYDANGNKSDFKNSFNSLILSFHEKEVDVCFEECSSVKYTLNDTNLVISDGTDFSGEYEIDDNEDTTILKKKNSDGSTIYYYFVEPKG